MSRTILLLGCILLCSLVFGQNKETYSIIELELEHHDDIAILLDLGIAVDHVHMDNPGSVELFISQREKKILVENGFTFKKIVADTKLQADKEAEIYARKPYKTSACGLDSFNLGSVGGYHSYEEVVAILQKLNTEHPELTMLTILGQSYEGRDIIALKISDNATLDESETEPSAYYDALTHAREPLGMMSTLYYIYWLLENYDNPDEVARFYVDNRELYFVLVVNPDGYVYNAEIAPNGGGGWRKNRKPITGECIGVDLNRNFSTQWNGPGSHSLQPCSDIYRGETPASEVEIQIVQEYIDEIKPKSGFSSHSYSQVMIDPYKKDDNPNYDFQLYSTYASEFTPLAYAGYGSAGDLIGYLASGTTLDYLSSNGTIAWTPEIGTRFWEAQDKICGYTQEMLEPMKFISKIAGEAPSYHNHHISADEKIINGNSVELTIDIINKGLTRSDEDITVELIPLNTSVTVQNSSLNYSAPVNELNLYTQPEKFILDIVDTKIGDPIHLELRILKNNLLTETKEISIFPGEYNLLFEDDLESGMDNWIASSNGEPWSISDIDSKSGDHSLVDSKLTYAPETVSVVQSADPISLTDGSNPWLFFNIKYALRPSTAFLRVLVSSDAINWRLMKSDGTRLFGNDTSYSGHRYWSQEFIDLSDFASENDELYIRFELTTRETNNTSDGVYLDDIRVIDYFPESEPTSTVGAITKSDVHIYPNPTDDVAYISLTHPVNKKMNINIYNNLGQVVKQFHDQNSSDRLKMDVSSLPNGPYILQLQIGQLSINKKFIKN